MCLSRNTVHPRLEYGHAEQYPQISALLERVRRLLGLGSAQNSEALTDSCKVGPRQSYEHKSSLLLLAVSLHGGLEMEISHDKTKEGY